MPAPHGSFAQPNCLLSAAALRITAACGPSFQLSAISGQEGGCAAWPIANRPQATSLPYTNRRELRRFSWLVVPWNSQVQQPVVKIRQAECLPHQVHLVEP